MERQRLKLSLNRRTNPRMAGEKRRRQPNGRQFFERNFRMFLQRQCIDILFRNKKQHLVSPRAQHFSHGKSREEVPPVPPHAMMAFIMNSSPPSSRAAKTARDLSSIYARAKKYFAYVCEVPRRLRASG